MRTSRSSRPEAARSAPSRLIVNFALISVRSSSRGAKRDVEPQPADVHVHPPLGAQAHLDPLALAVEEGDVLEGVDVEVGVELAVDDAQDVAVELGRHAGAVVVGGLEHRRVLDQVGAQQQMVDARAQQLGDARAGSAAACPG